MAEDPLERIEREEREKKNRNTGLKTATIVLAAAAALLAGALGYITTQKNGLVRELEAEKADLTEQMVALQNDFANLSSDYETINSQLDTSREQVALLIDKLSKTEATNRAKIRQYEKELGTLRSIMRGYIVQIDSLNTLNKKLTADAAAARQEANIDEIIDAADGVMVARGDMGVEIPLEDVPVIQKMIIKKVYEAGKFVVTATQMLDSMISHPRPTRAEATDVANAVYDGTSAIMLSGETAAGKYPVEAVATMDRIARRTEQDIHYRSRMIKNETDKSESSITDGITHSACLLAGDLNATAIVTVTKSGRTAHAVSKFRPASPIIAGCIDDKVCRQMNLCWGTTPIMIQEEKDAEELFAHTISRCEEENLLVEGDVIVLIAGVPLGISGTTNLIKAQMV